MLTGPSRPEAADGERAPADERRHAVLTAAVDLCRERGYAATSLADVAERAGGTVDDLVREWSSKAALVITAFRRVMAAELRYADTGDFRADLRAQLSGMARLLADPGLGPLLTDLVAEAQRDRGTALAFAELVFRPNRAAARDRFASAQRAGQVRAGIDLDVAIDLTFAPLWFRFLLRTGPLSAAYAEQVADAALGGLAPGPGAAHVTPG
ncbi:MAG: TetR/AcrR family transcriptional regulator C-terminal ligand-binding domain-containing protein [Frankiaceae bacterium]